MMRGTLALALVFLAATPANAGEECELDSTDTVDHAANAALAIWASTRRCHGTLLSEAPVKCEQDVSTSIQELIEMGSAIGGMVGHCGALKLKHYKCGRAADDVVAAAAGLAAASGQIADDCTDLVPEALDGDVLDTATTLGKCTADAAGSMNSFFHAHNSIQDLKKHCGGDGGKKCTVDALDVTGVLAGFGAYIAAAYTDCSEYTGRATKTDLSGTPSDCSDAVLSGIEQLTTLAKLGLEMKDACESMTDFGHEGRLYLDNNSEAAAATGSPLVLALAAVLPISAVLSFIAGSRFAKSRQQTSARDADLLESGSE